MLLKRIGLVFLLLVALGPRVVAQTETPLWKTQPVPPPLPKADKSGFAPVNQINLYYAVFNQNGKDPVILLHGGFVSSDEWGFEVPLLSKTHQVIVVDSRGHGRSTLGSAPLSYQLLSSDVLALMDYLNIKKASIVGWSDGGIIGMILSAKYPPRIDKLFTFGANYNLAGYKNEAGDPEAGKRFMANAEANYRKVSATPDSFAQLKTALGKMYSSEPNLNPAELKTIKAPTVIACGQYEQFIKAEHFRELAALIPAAKLVVIPNVSHGGPLQDPISFHEAVAGLLDTAK
ncbi:alpha/beta fold hydrolase [Mucilaginibacter sp. SG564]|uniref:alpha/beta fold hydrolase n=1 Tax=Mucilaginibacter sp. SG564 TaxID=2587022 RepID=UPI00155828B9|nr:alpha/beta hydrolase [Mucilaginibacter sp. SG564]NOW96111.1 pimeloyl-ACP methyl ester carboxylesterase [Mucilaginibacter sp. SG564]